MCRSKKSISNSILFAAKYDEVSWENYIVTVCEIGTDPVLYVKRIVLYFWTVPKHSSIASSAWLQRVQRGESTNFLEYRKWPVGSSLYNGLY